MSKRGRQILIDRIPEQLYIEFQALTRRRGNSLAGTIRDMMQAAISEDDWFNQGGRFDVGDGQDRTET